MKKNIYLFYTISFLETFVFTTAIWAFFFTSYLNFSFGQALFLMTVVGIVSTIFEVPSGAWADRFGRKKMYILGTVLLMVQLIIWCYASDFFSFLLAGICAGLGYAITSGNLEAIIHDELEEQKNEKEFKNIASNSYVFIFLGRAFATAISGLLFVFHPLLPIYLTLASTTLILWFALFIKEPKQILSQHKDNISHLKESMNFLRHHKNILLFMLILGLLSGLGNIYWFTQQPYFKEIGFSIEFIGFTFTIGALFSALGSYVFKKLSDHLTDKNILHIMLIMVVCGSILFTLFSKIFALFGLIILSLVFGYIMTFGNNYLITKVPKNQKSTILSIFSLFITLGYSGINIILSGVIGFLGLYNIYLGAMLALIILFLVGLLSFS